MRDTRPSAHKRDGSKKRRVDKLTMAQCRQKLFGIEIGAYKRICLAVNTPFAQKCLALVESEDYSGLLLLPMPDAESSHFHDDYLVWSILRKNPRLPLGIDRKAAAISSFRSGEQGCRETNDLFSKIAGDYASPKSASLALKPARVKAIRDFIRDVLGPIKPWLQLLPGMTRFGPGAQFHCSGKDLTPFKKVGSRMGITPRLMPFVGALEPHGLIQASAGYGLTAGSRASCAPKDAQTDRFIAIEPSIAMMWQLAIGGALRSRLKTFGLDLDNQAACNRLRAKHAQENGDATIDLRNASNSIARKLVMWLLPPDWAHLLALFRSPKMKVEGEWVDLEMFSSMGNGYTFELETLIFWAIARAYDPSAVAFGDDIITTQECAKEVIEALRIFGFATNARKTYLAGTFFESCGEDYWHGRNVRPFYFRKEIKTNEITPYVVRMANAVRLYAHRRNLGCGCDRRFLAVHRYLVQRCGDARYSAIPKGYGDDGIIRNWDEAAPSRNYRDGHEGWISRPYAATPVKVRGDHLAGLYARLMGSTCCLDSSTDWLNLGTAMVIKPRQRRIPSTDVRELFMGFPSPEFEVRGRMHRYKIQNRLVKDWPDLGPWV